MPAQKRCCDLSWKEKTQTLRKRHAPAFLHFLQKKLSSHLRGPQTILEIGSGPIDRGESYLSSLVKQIGAFDWIFTDQSDFDLTDPHFGNKQIVDRVIGCNVLDTLAYSDFQRAFQKIHSILKGAGAFIHLADLNFFTTSFLDACSQKSCALFPSSNSLASISCLTQSEYNPSSTHPFLHFWIKQPPQIQAIALNNAFLLKIDLSPLAKLAKEHFYNSLKTIDFKETFEASILQAAHSSQFELLECKAYPVTVSIPHFNEIKDNVFISDLFHTSSHYDPSIMRGMTKIEAQFHLIVAKKEV